MQFAFFRPVDLQSILSLGRHRPFSLTLMGKAKLSRQAFVD